MADNSELGVNTALGPYRDYRCNNFNALNIRRKKLELAEEKRLKREENAVFDEKVKKEEQEEVSAKKAKANKRKAYN